MLSVSHQGRFMIYLPLIIWIKICNKKCGPNQGSFGEYHGPLHRVWPEIFKAMNLESTGDSLAGLGTGGHSNPASVDPQTKARSHGGSEYYSPEVASRSNLSVLTEALVEKIICGKAKLT